MDEPASAFGPDRDQQDRRLIETLKKDFTVVIVTHSMQAGGSHQRLHVVLPAGELVESGTTSTMFTKPRDKRTEDYITDGSAEQLGS